ncbi:hypothetical protein BJ165DRAFT_1534118 [Panaeolus papilionaceus]|nr:hypothetical protein BJ165DRAFT_1534118 [Panaeolus papilionaceus]
MQHPDARPFPPTARCDPRSPPQDITACQMPSSPPLLYTVNAFLMLLLRHPVVTPEGEQAYARLILDLSSTLAELDERVQALGRFDYRNNWMSNMSQHCFQIFVDTLALFPDHAVMPNVITVFEQYLKNPPLVQPIPIASPTGFRQRRLSNASTSSEVSYIQKYLSKLKEDTSDVPSRAERNHSPAICVEFDDESDNDDYWANGRKVRATQHDVERGKGHSLSKSRVMRPIINLPKRAPKPTRPLSNLRFSFSG